MICKVHFNVCTCVFSFDDIRAVPTEDFCHNISKAVIEGISLDSYLTTMKVILAVLVSIAITSACTSNLATCGPEMEPCECTAGALAKNMWNPNASGKGPCCSPLPNFESCEVSIGPQSGNMSEIWCGDYALVCSMNTFCTKMCYNDQCSMVCRG